MQAGNENDERGEGAAGAERDQKRDKSRTKANS